MSRTARIPFALVPPAEPVDQMTERRRARARARTIASIGVQRPADDVRHYSGGHVWTRRPEHESFVLRVLQGRCFG